MVNVGAANGQSKTNQNWCSESYVANMYAFFALFVTFDCIKNKSQLLCSRFELLRENNLLDLGYTLLLFSEGFSLPLFGSLAQQSSWHSEFICGIRPIYGKELVVFLNLNEALRPVLTVIRDVTFMVLLFLVSNAHLHGRSTLV